MLLSVTTQSLKGLPVVHTSALTKKMGVKFGQRKSSLCFGRLFFFVVTNFSDALSPQKNVMGENHKKGSNSPRCDKNHRFLSFIIKSFFMTPR